MSVPERSHGSAGRPVPRPVGGALCAIAVLAPLGVGAPSAAASEPAAVVAPGAPQVEAPAPPVEPEVAAPAEPVVEPPAEPEVVAPAEPEVVAPAEPEVVAPAEPEVVAPAEPEVVAPAEPVAEPPAEPEIDAPAEPVVEPPAEPEVVAPAEPEIEPPGDPQPEPPAEPEAPGTSAIARNESTVIQAVWQIQRGCETYCYGTSQTQSVTQSSSTWQDARADAGDVPSSAAEATNASVTVQVAWQLQIGCVAFCYDTRQEQAAAQVSHTVQVAQALAAVAAWAENFAETIQQVWQFQQGCEAECHGTSQSQSITQVQITEQSASSITLPALPLGDGAEPPELPAWLIALAANIGATIQVVLQYEESECRHHCYGDRQEQWSFQVAETDQEAVAVALIEEEPEVPPAKPPPAAEAPPPPAADPVDEEAAAALALAAFEPAAQPATAAPPAASLGVVVRTLRSVKPRGDRRVPAERVATRSSLRLAAAAPPAPRAERPAEARREERTGRVYAGGSNAPLAPPVASAAHPYNALDPSPDAPARIALLTLAVVSLTYAGFAVRRRIGEGRRSAAKRP